MESLKQAVQRLEQAQKKLDDFRATFYMPWEGEEPMTAEERRARDKLRDAGMKLAEEVKAAQKELVSVAKTLTQEPDNTEGIS